MKKLSILIIVLILFFNTGLIAQAKITPDEELNNIKRDIIGLNLLNGLYLSDKQLQQYLNVLKQFQSYENSAKDLYNKYKQTEKSSYNKLKYELINNPVPSKGVLSEARFVHNQAKRYNNSYMEKFYQCEQELKSILNDNQLSIVNDFKPCLIPKQDFINPSRVGQANDSKRIEKIITRIRKLPQNQYYKKREDFFYNKYLDKYEKNIKKLSASEQAQEKSKLYRVFDQARKLSDVDFEIQKHQLAETIKPPKKKHDIDLKKNQLSLLGKVMLNTNLIPVVEKRIGH